MNIIKNNAKKHKRLLERIIEEKELKAEAFDILLYVATQKPYNINAINDASDLHGCYCGSYALLLLEELKYMKGYNTIK